MVPGQTPISPSATVWPWSWLEPVASKVGALDLLRNYFRKEEVGVGGDGKGGPEKVHCR